MAASPYSSPQLGSFRLTTSGGSARRTVADLPPAALQRERDGNQGWDLTIATCSDGGDARQHQPRRRARL